MATMKHLPRRDEVPEERTWNFEPELLEVVDPARFECGESGWR